jgi:sugar phosphate isomerase/epimerase
MSPPLISAPSMVFGMDLVENVKNLSRIVNHIEIVIFHTPELHNIPTAEEILFLKEIKTEKYLSYSIHLPASLEIAAESELKRKNAVRMATQIIAQLSELDPEYHVLHIPITTPTLTAEPGCYIMDKGQFMYAAWADRAIASLNHIQKETGLKQRLLLENINYSPKLLELIREQGSCAFCLDIGHLLLGRESVRKTLKRYLPVIKEIHIHGVMGWDEHLGLEVLPEVRVQSWFHCLNDYGYTGILNLEVFDPVDLKKSLQVLEKMKNIKPGDCTLKI